MFSQFLQLQSSPALEGMTEPQLKELISKLKVENSTLETEIVKFKTEISSFLNSQNELKSRNSELEKELQQSRLQSKLKISQLQKEISFLASSNDKAPSSDRNTTPASANPLQSNKTTSATQSMAISISASATQSDTYEIPPVTASLSATQYDSSATQTAIIKLADYQPTDIATQTVPTTTPVTNDSATEKPTVPENSCPDITYLDFESQTEADFLKEEENRITEEVKKEMKKETEEKITNLRIVHKETVSSLAVQIQELKAELKLEDANKSLEESLKDLQNQVEILKEDKDNSKDKVQEYERIREENDEKIRKMKGLLIAANKKLLEYKELTGNLRNELKEANEKKQEISGNEVELSKKLKEEQEKYETEILEYSKTNEKQQGIIAEKNKEMENMRDETNKIQEDFQNYRVKAQLALQQSSNTKGLEAKIIELEEFNSKLESQIAALESENMQSNEALRRLQHELEESMTHNQALNEKLSELQKNAKERFHLQQDLESKRMEIEDLKLAHIKETEQIKKDHEEIQDLLNNQILNLQSDAKLTMDDHTQKMMEYLNSTQNLKAELSQARNQIEQLKLNSGPVALNLSRPSSPFFEKPLAPNSPLLRRSSSNIFNNMDSGGVSSFKIKEMAHKIDQLSHLLTESEANVERLLEQEKFLKEQVRSQDRIEVLEKRLSIEYLKNIVLSFFESKSKQSLIPVLSRVLELSPDEEQKLWKTTNSTFGFL